MKNEVLESYSFEILYLKSKAYQLKNRFSFYYVFGKICILIISVRPKSLSTFAFTLAYL